MLNSFVAVASDERSAAHQTIATTFQTTFDLMRGSVFAISGYAERDLGVRRYVRFSRARPRVAQIRGRCKFLTPLQNLGQIEVMRAYG